MGRDLPRSRAGAEVDQSPAALADAGEQSRRVLQCGVGRQAVVRARRRTRGLWLFSSSRARASDGRAEQESRRRACGSSTRARGQADDAGTDDRQGRRRLLYHAASRPSSARAGAVSAGGIRRCPWLAATRSTRW